MNVLKPATALRLGAVAVLMLVLLAVAQPTLAAPPVGLFSDSTARADANVHPYPAAVIMRSRTVNVSFDMLPQASRAKGSTLLLNLFADASLTAIYDRTDVFAQGSVWVGHVDGIPMSSVTLATAGNVMAGSVLTPGAVYAIRYMGNGVHGVYQIKQAAFAPEAKPLAASAASPNAAPRLPSALYKLFLPFIANNFTTGVSIDVLIVYTPAAQTAAGGPSAIAALIAAAESITNTSYGNSAISQRIHIAGSALVNYTETGNIETELNNLTNATGALSGVPALRDQYHADLVDMFVSYTANPFCGVAWLNSNVNSAFSVVDQQCAVDNLSFPHELGHNMGALHDWYVDDTGNPSGPSYPFPYAHGYVYTPGQWRTIMAYNNLCGDQFFNCTRLPYWSNPAITNGGVPMGVADGTRRTCIQGNIGNPPCDADDHKVLNATAATIAAFK